MEEEPTQIANNSQQTLHQRLNSIVDKYPPDEQPWVNDKIKVAHDKQVKLVEQMERKKLTFFIVQSDAFREIV